MIEGTKIPRYALYRRRKVRVAGYDEGRFLIIDTDDSQTWVKRDQLTFLRGKK